MIVADHVTVSDPVHADLRVKMLQSSVEKKSHTRRLNGPMTQALNTLMQKE